jgi:hypothetical protein
VYYWNKDNFESLLELADALAADPQLVLLAEYCKLREKGLRRQAFAALDEFLTETTRWDSSSARSRALAVLNLHLETQEAHQFLSQPLLGRFLLPVLAAWHREGSASPEAIRWLGILSRDHSLVGLALERDPTDDLARRYLVDAELSHVGYATHHLDESQFIGSESDAETAIERARELLLGASDQQLFADLSSELSTLDQMLTDWVEFRESSDESFPEWCEARGRSYSWPAKFYYDDGAA